MKAHVQKSKLEQLGVLKIPKIKSLQELFELFGYTKDDMEKMKKDNLKVFDGDTVKLDVQKMKSRKEWPRLNPKYRQFVEDNADREFTAGFIDNDDMVDGRIEKNKKLYTFTELQEDTSDPKWRFHVDDLIVVKRVFDEKESKNDKN